MNVYDCIIIGSGIAGCTAALEAADNGMDVCIFTKEEILTETNTRYAQGGIVTAGIDDSPEKLAEDIYKAGSFINNRKAVEIVTREGPRAVKEMLIEKVEVPFVRQEAGNLDYTREGGHSTRRIIHVRDKTGLSIEECLSAKVQAHDSISVFTAHMAVDLITNSHHSTDPGERYRETEVVGVYVFDEHSEAIVPFFAPHVVLATGGAGNLYLHTSNPSVATGDGTAMAYRTGAQVINAEYIQFHPTILYHRDIKRFLISEALRGEGAKLMNRSGEYFMERYNPELKDLAPRDEVARAIISEMDAGGNSYLYLDATCIKKVDLPDRFPHIYQTCKDGSIDIEKEPIPIVPAAHYFCGGIKVDLSGRTNIPGLYAVGETSCTGVHGANRLASVSLLEGLVFGRRVAGRVVQSNRKNQFDLIKSIPDWVYPQYQEEFDPVLIRHDLLHIQTTMWNYVGIKRTRKRLLRASSDLEYISHRIERFYKTAHVSKKIIELRNAVVTSMLIAKAALGNPISIGCHFIE